MKDGKPHPITYETDGFFTFHHINAYEQDNEIIVDVAGYNNGDVYKYIHIINNRLINLNLFIFDSLLN
jgi:carotenoid cleavage dioxygenase-like enzyme